MLRRKVEQKITDWIRYSKSALLVSGARQVGKTFTIRECLKKEGCDFLEVNLVEHPELVPVFEKAVSFEDLKISLSAVFGYHFEKGKSFLFIDEIQEAKDVATKIKFWVDEGSCRYILSGSLLGVELKDVRSAPVGYLEEIQMYPLDFAEFLDASEVLPETIQYLKKCFDEKTPVLDAVHEKMMTHFYRYLVVGGMPAALDEYAKSRDIGRVTEIQRNILELYKKDFSKYEQKEKKLMLIALYEAIPSQLLKQNKRFNFSDVQKKLRFERLESSFLWLSASGVAIPTYNATEPRVALKQNQKSSCLKLYSSDVGLLTEQYGDALRMNILLRDEKVNLGGVFENAVAQELHAHGFASYYYNSHKIGELDFLIEKGLEVVPLEVKSGKDYYVHSAISTVVNNPEYKINNAFVFANCNVSIKEKITYMPVYLCTFLNKALKMPVLEKI